MRKLFTLAIMFLALTTAAFAQNKKVAILETLDREGNVPYGVKLQLRSSLTYAISNTSGYEGYDRVDMGEIMGEQDFQRTGMVSDDQIRQLGEMTGASLILVSEVAIYDNQHIILSAKILNVETAGVESNPLPITVATDPESMQNACNKLAKKLLGTSLGEMLKKSIFGN